MRRRRKCDSSKVSFDVFTMFFMLLMSLRSQNLCWFSQPLRFSQRWAMSTLGGNDACSPCDFTFLYWSAQIFIRALLLGHGRLFLHVRINSVDVERLLKLHSEAISSGSIPRSVSLVTHDEISRRARMRRWHPQEIVRQLRVVGSVVPAKFSVKSRVTTFLRNRSCDGYARKNFNANVVLSGGTNMFEEFLSTDE